VRELFHYIQDACKYEVQVEQQLSFCLMKLEDGEGYTWGLGGEDSMVSI